MPQFVMEGILEPDFQDLPAFVQGYIQALFFTNTSNIAMCEFHSPKSQHLIAEGQADGELPGDSGFPDLHPDALAEIKADCGTFHVKARALLQEAYERDGYDAEQAGMDFWYTRNGHGVGFWDRELGQIGEDLSEIARTFGEVNPWFSDTREPASPTGYGYVYHDS